MANKTTQISGTFGGKTASATLEIGYPPSAPTISPSAGTYAVETMVSISAGAGNVHYTTDGSDPTPQSTAYTGPFSMPSSAGPFTVKAIAVSATGYESPVAVSAFTTGFAVFDNVLFDTNSDRPYPTAVNYQSVAVAEVVNPELVSEVLVNGTVVPWYDPNGPAAPDNLSAWWNVQYGSLRVWVREPYAINDVMLRSGPHEVSFTPVVMSRYNFENNGRRITFWGTNLDKWIPSWGVVTGGVGAYGSGQVIRPNLYTVVEHTATKVVIDLSATFAVFASVSSWGLLFGSDAFTTPPVSFDNPRQTRMERSGASEGPPAQNVIRHVQGTTVEIFDYLARIALNPNESAGIGDPGQLLTATRVDMIPTWPGQYTPAPTTLANVPFWFYQGTLQLSANNAAPLRTGLFNYSVDYFVRVTLADGSVWDTPPYIGIRINWP